MGASIPKKDGSGLVGFEGSAFGFFSGEQGVEEEQAGADDDGAIGNVEVGPVIAEDVDLDEVDDRAVEDAVVEVADGAAEDQSESDSGEGDPAAEADEGDEHGEWRRRRKRR